MTKNNNNDVESQNDDDSTGGRIACSGISCCDTSGKCIGWGVLALVFLITSITLIGVCLEKLQSTEYGLEYNVHSKKLDDAAKTGGLHAGPPGFEFIKFPSTFITAALNDGKCVSQDGLRVRFAVTFQYQIPGDWVMPAVVKYRDFKRWAEVVEAAGNSAVQHACSQFTISNFQNKRGVIQITMEDFLRTKLEGESGNGSDGVFARAISLQLSNVLVPEEYRDAIERKQSASEDIALAKNQRTQEKTKAQTALLTAKEESRKILDAAFNDANVTITEARLKAEETTFAFETEAEVIAGVKSQLNLTTEGVLAYLANELYAEVPNLKVSAAEPARISRQEEL